MLAPFAKAREKLIDPIQCPPDWRCDLGQLKVFFYRQTRNDPAVLGNQPQPNRSRLVAGHVVQWLVVQPDFPMSDLWVVETGN